MTKPFCALAIVSLAIAFTNSVQAKTETQPPSDDDWWVEYEPGEGPGNGRHVVLISGDEEYRSEEALPMLGQILAKHVGFKCTVLFPINPETGEIDPNNQRHIPGMEKLKTADLVIISLRFRQLPDMDMQYFHDYLQAGKPIIGLRTSTHAFQYPGDSDSKFAQYGTRSKEWPGGFGKHVLGETWVSHHGHHKRESTRGIINEQAAGNPILTGVEDVWGPTDVYGIRKLPDNANVLMLGQVLEGMEPDDAPVEGKKNDPMMPLVWTRMHTFESGEESKVFCTTMGSSTDFESADLRRLIVNASLWCVDSEDEISEDLSVDYVSEFEPTDYGFNSFRKGMKPADFEID